MSRNAADHAERRAMASVWSMDDLVGMRAEELRELYGIGRIPDSLEGLRGSPRCRVLAAYGLAGREPLAGWLRRFAASSSFPWAGKRFGSLDAEHGTGANRIRIFGELELFPFHTGFAPSTVDGRLCIQLDYDLPENPWFVRRISDELREIGDQLYLGLAIYRTLTRPRPLFYFAVDHR